MGKITAAITGVGAYLPDYILDNDELSKMVDTTNEWIMTRVGIETRHILKGNKGTSYMAINAVKDLLEKTNTDPDDIDLLICATVTPDMFFPSTANLICEGVGIKNGFCFDMSAACSGFLYGLQTVTRYIESGKYKKIILVGADKMSSIIDYTDRATCPLFGDGAAAFMIEPNYEGYGLLDFVSHIDGSGTNALYMKSGGSLNPTSLQTVLNREHYVTQDGQTVFKAAVTRMADVTVEVMERNNITAENLKYLVPHQANMRIINAAMNRAGISNDQCMITIQKFGNTTGGTLPLCIWDYESRLSKGDNIIFTAFGGGFTWGSVYCKWAYDGGTMEK